MSSQLDKVLERLEGPKRIRGKNLVARCPAHEDTTPSLSITETSDSVVLLKCFAGCSVANIVAALGLGMKDLFPGR